MLKLADGIVSDSYQYEYLETLTGFLHGSIILCIKMGTLLMVCNVTNNSCCSIAGLSFVPVMFHREQKCLNFSSVLL